ncbi:acetolactate decarboxylase [Companilactobacillus alimentarius]|uniref:Alpha-acetolactate decarboxylase n=1 Tax=Companilactobacillus alimentarius DSM 20249 TaxID=1423720 RepID=A0A2K9HJJ3_9LACO|nr:acetolactate decarboxylase [Companilactobacillus alimentarius]AUI72548.1 alpha-acetolactate decarboxylase [Companilactobacillus alimentarius DSM 20249]KRK77682.1 alpha-acetolactate decarboxylase [Companilactobacillus alimentarius DSM 20249]MDT6953142.1 acetolactate decarboxylase [Companilactobacillus alimentarius]GEO45081.1 alpha-acetolactate decarboxylase [Companilactobacillus alimentarius]
MSNTNVLYQHGTLALLVPGLLDGTITMKELLTHGDTGIGTGEGLDGELIILDGTPYQVDSTGSVNIVKGDFTLPFANIHYGNYHKLLSVENISQKELEKRILAQTSINTFFSIKVHGTFKDVKTRAVKKSHKPYDTLAKTAEAQSVFDRQEVSGTVLSYFSPTVFDGAAVAGFHHHFISDKHDFGGHLLSLGTVSGDVEIQQFDTLEQHLPVKNQDYMDFDFSQCDILGDIHKAE